METSTKTKPVGFIGAGWSGQTSAQFFARGKAMIPIWKPSVCVFPAYTPNDAVASQYEVNKAVDRAIDFIEFCYQNNVTPVCRTPVPYKFSGNEPRRLDVLNRIKALGILVLDANDACYDSTNVSGGYWKSGYDADGTHPSPVGNTAIKNKLKDLLRILI